MSKAGIKTEGWIKKNFPVGTTIRMTAEGKRLFGSKSTGTVVGYCRDNPLGIRVRLAGQVAVTAWAALFWEVAK